MIVRSAIALPLAEAKEMLERAGVAVVEVAETRPPEAGKPPGVAPVRCAQGRPRGPLRVVRERYSADGAHLVVAAAVPLPAEEGSDATLRSGEVPGPEGRDGGPEGLASPSRRSTSV
jgi:hypothetical protein